MKRRDDFDDIEDIIDDDEILDDDEEIIDDEEIEEERPRRNAPRAQKRPDKKKGKSKGAKVAIISSSVVVGVIAIALVVLLVILPMFGITVFGKKNKVPNVTTDLYYDPTASYGLYFYGDNHEPYNDDMSDVDMVRASKTLSKSYLDPSKPTIIWFHGWEPTGSVGDRYLMAGGDTLKQYPSYDASYAHELKQKGYNVATFQFQGVESSDKNYASNLAVIYKYAVDSFNDTEYSLSFMFASELIDVFGESYAKDITFVGHSCGGFMATATDYMLQAMYNSKKTSNEHLIAKRLALLDPYVNTLGDKEPGYYLMGTDDEIGDRSKCVYVQDMLCSLHENSNVAIDVYFGMSGASKDFITVDDAQFAKVKQHVVMIDMTAIKGTLSNPFYAHVVTRDWVWASSLASKLKDQNGDLAPSLACTNEEILSMVGNLYQQTYKGFDLSKDSLKKVDDTSGFKF